MNKLITLMAGALILVPTLVLASPGDDGCVGNCPNNGGGNGPVDVSQQQQQGQLQGQSQESFNANLNKNYNDSNASADSSSQSSSDSNAIGVGVGGGATVDVAVDTGPTSSRSKSNAEGGAGGDGGDATAYGGAAGDGGDAYSGSYSSGGDASVGDTVASSTGGASDASVGDTTTGDVNSAVSISDNSSYSVNYEEAAARAATVYSEVCMNGGSAQMQAGGFGVNNQDVVCEHLKVAAVMREAYQWEMQHGSAVCQPIMSGQEVGVGDVYSDTCMSEKAIFYYKAYSEHMVEALQAMEAYEEAGLMDKIAGALVRPLALIGALIWLI